MRLHVLVVTKTIEKPHILQRSRKWWSCPLASQSSTFELISFHARATTTKLKNKQTKKNAHTKPTQNGKQCIKCKTIVQFLILKYCVATFWLPFFSAESGQSSISFRQWCCWSGWKKNWIGTTNLWMVSFAQKKYKRNKNRLKIKSNNNQKEL